MASPDGPVLGVTSLFPNRWRPVAGIFVYRLFTEMERQGLSVDVVAPQSWIQKVLDPIVRTSSAFHDTQSVVRPPYLNLASHLAPSSRAGRMFSYRSFAQAVDSALGSRSGYRWLYAHFFLSGLASLPYCQATGTPCIVGIGESNLNGIEHLVGPDCFAKALSRFSGIIAVSKQAEQYCRERCPALGSRLTHIPNGVDTSQFMPQCQVEARRRLNLNTDSKIVIFCGHFVERKGPFRVLAAVNKLSNTNVVFLGEGKPAPGGSQVLYTGRAEADQVPLWLAAADVFVLPSLSEGMSNAIIEALACGLPVVVSDRAFNREFLSEDCAVFVDPTSPEAITDGIAYVLEREDRRRQMSSAAIDLAQSYSLANRAANITRFAGSIVARSH